MPNLAAIIPFLWLLVFIAIGAAIIYAFFWFLGQIGVPVPDKAKQITLAIYAVIVLIWILTFLAGGSVRLPG